jgi:hypothetical protein
MASGPPEHHMDRPGRRLGDRSCNPVLAPEEWVGSYKLMDTERFVRGASSVRPSAGDVEEADFLARRFIESANCLRCRLNYNLLGKEGTCLLVA